MEDMVCLEKVSLHSPNEPRVLQKFRRRKVSAVRNFPPGCGPNVAACNVPKKANAVDCTSNDGKMTSSKTIIDNLDVQIATKSEGCTGAESTEISKRSSPVATTLLENACSTSVEVIDVYNKECGSRVPDNVKDLVTDIPIVCDGSFIEVPKVLHCNDECDNDKKVESADLVKSTSAQGMETACDNGRQVESADFVKSASAEGVETALNGDISANGILDVPKSTHMASTNFAGISKKYIRKRKISAVRDFPPLVVEKNLNFFNKLKQNAGAPSIVDIAISDNAVTQKMVGPDGPRACDGSGRESILNEVACMSKASDREFAPGSVRDSKRKSSIEVQKEETLHVYSNKKKARNEFSTCSDKDNKDNSSQLDSGFSYGDRKGDNVFRSSEELCKAIVIAEKDEVPKGVSDLEILQSNSTASDLPFDIVIVQGLVAAPFCPWRTGKSLVKTSIPIDKIANKGDGRRSKGKVQKSSSPEMIKPVSKTISGDSLDLQACGNDSLMDKSPPNQCSTDGTEIQPIKEDTDCSGDIDEGSQHRIIVPSRHTMHVNPLPLRVVCPTSDQCEHDGVSMRIKVRETLRLFQAVFRRLMHEEESHTKDGKSGVRRIDLQASQILKSKGRYVNVEKKIIGPVPGVEVGDEFHYRVELAIIGVHHVLQGGIDYVKHDQILATSIVASGGYADDMDNSDVLIYSGSGGNVMGGDKEPTDQKLERGNLALKNCALAKTPVRVIRGFKESKVSESSDAKVKKVLTYTYDGLYSVEKFWQEVGQHGKLVFKFQLIRLPGQPELAWKEVRKSQKSVREGVCMKDISQGEELMPICVVNTLDNEKPPPFKYSTNVIYSRDYQPILSVGCDCIGGCSDSVSCSCAVKNGGEIPYNQNGAIVEAKSLVYECGPSCKCPPSCPNRVSQNGIRFQLEVFKTESRGWGVRSLNSISSGSFICEYTGEILEEKEAERRIENDEYLFDIGNMCTDHSLWKGLESLVEDSRSGAGESLEDAGFTIDAAFFGSVGRFINHSCSPNLYAQNVLYDHHDKRMPHIMLFAAENIPPLQELTYHYNYKVDQVRDSQGNIKMKSCYCGTPECTGRMY